MIDGKAVDGDIAFEEVEDGERAKKEKHKQEEKRKLAEIIALKE